MIGFIVIVVACLLDHPTQCREDRMQFVEDGGCYAPNIQAGPIHEWTQSHPRWSLQTWECYPRGKVKEAV